MNTKGAIRWYWVAMSASLILFIISHFLGNTDEEDLRRSQTRQANEAAAEMLDLVDEGEKAMSTTDTFIGSDKLPQWWRMFHYLGETVDRWTHNEWIPDSAMLAIDGVQFVSHQGGWDILINDRKKHLAISHALIRYPQGSFEYRNYIHPLQSENFELVHKVEPHQLWKDVYISFYGNSEDKTASAWLHICGLLFALIAFGIAFFFWKNGTWITVVFVLLIRIGTFNGWIHAGLSSLFIFNPTIFASIRGLPSLGDLGLHIFCALIIAYTIHALYHPEDVKDKRLEHALLFLAGLILFFGADLIRSVIVSLVKHSNISFDVTNLSTLTLYTAVATFFIFVLVWLYFTIIRSFISTDKFSRTQIFIFAGAAGVFFMFQILDARRSISGLLPSLIFAILILFLLQWKRNKALYQYISFLLLISLFYSQTVFQTQREREVEYLNHYAAKLISNKDLEAEYIFKNMENSLVAEFLQPEDFAAFANRKDQFERRLRRLYFGGYLDRYNLLVISFDSVGNNINSSTRYSYEDLNYLYNFQAFPTMSNHFYQVKSTEIFNGYLAKFENCDLHGHYGNIFILLEPKFIQSSYEYPQLAQKRPEQKVIDLENYSYAIYNRNRLMHQKGSYSYDLLLDSAKLMNEEPFGRQKKFEHFISRQDETSVVVLSHPNTHRLAIISTFSFSLVFFALCWLALSAIWWLFIYLTERYLRRNANSVAYQNFRYSRLQRLSRLGIEQIFLSTRIRFAMVGLVLVGLLISLYVTIEFIRINDQRRSERELMYKIREVANQIQNEVDMPSKLKDSEARQLIVNEIGDVFKVEANIFDPKGYLLASSVQELYDKHIMAPVMDPVALDKLSEKRSSQIIQNEHLRNVQFTSAYIPLLNENRQVIAYLNLPYFSQQNELDHEISSFTVTFVNLYLFLMLLAFVLAFIVSQRISKPLQIIREKMSQTGLGTSNEMIEWKRNDEIGKLVQQYNKMVVQLEESALKLSASEREGAWKEMARQVAHEIKNPLTPMKLNIQHLQRAWADNSDKLEVTFKRVTAVLIEQIEGLSHLASEFSSFANMPVDNFEICDLTEILTNNIILFEKTDNVFFSYDPNMPNVEVYADKNHLKRIFTNVIKNAIQAMEEDQKGKIEIRMELQEKVVTIHIKDNGKGIPEEARSKIFVPNFSTKTSGMGLGLAMTKKMMEACGGDIWFDTRVGSGTEFHLRFPVHAE
ncbi:MAG: HAMP domain-containing protein [Bacteroidetes bacterium]|nr:HAMP domain-containing protein [Bacteroidota bacterium]